MPAGAVSFMIGSIVNKLFVGFSRRPQRYQLRYEIGIVNPSPRDVPMVVVCPLPPDTEYQTVRNTSFQPNVGGIGRESRHGNAYAWWDVVVPPGGGLTLTLAALLGVAPRNGTQKCVGSNPPAAFLNGDRYIVISDDIRHRAQEAVGSADDRSTIAMRCYEYVVSHIKYGQPITGLYTSEEALRLPVVDCGGFSTLLAAMLQSQGVPTRLVVGFWAGHQSNQMHAWIECEVQGGQWLPLDPSVDFLRQNGRTKKTGGFGHIGSDRIVFSHGCDLSIKVGNRSMETPILQYPVVVSDFFKSITTTLNVFATRL